MIRKILYLFFIPFYCDGQTMKLITQEYYFIGQDEKHKMVQIKDTLFDYGCYPTWRHCAEQPSEIFKIDTIYTFPNTRFVVLEDLNALNYATNELRSNRFRIYVFRHVSDTTLLWLNYTGAIDKDELNDLMIRMEAIDKKFFITFFSQKYLEKLELLKTVDTESEINKVIKKAKRKWKEVEREYFQSKNNHWNYGVPAEILNLVCIENGFNPGGVVEIINASKK